MNKNVPYEAIEDQVEAAFYALIFKPVVDLLRAASVQPALENSLEGQLKQALLTGRVQYGDGVFSGKFSSQISRALRYLGAKFDARQGVYRLAANKVPSWATAAAYSASDRMKKAHEGLKTLLDDMQTRLDDDTKKVHVDASSIVSAAEGRWKEQAKVLEVNPTITDESKAKLAREYSENMSLYIKDFSEKAIVDLRMVVEKNAKQGYRFDRLVEGIEHKYDVAKSKATFLARQETALFMSEFRKQRFGEAGVTRYTWSTSRDVRVRDDHEHLNGRVFFYSDPPIVDRATGRRANPGQDFRCRCEDIPVIEKMEAVA